MKRIYDLTDEDGEAIVAQLVSGDIHKDDYWFHAFRFFNRIGSKHGRQITFSGRPYIGILYKGGSNGDTYIAHLDNPIVVSYLLEHGFELPK